MTFSALEISMLTSKPLLLRSRFACGHLKVPSNACVVKVNGELYIRCLTCKRQHTREYDRSHK
jgi:hypothetical protein